MTSTAQAIEQSIQQLYVAYFNRPADTGGLAYWTSVVKVQNGSVLAVSAAFSQSAEYVAAYAGMSNAQIVNQVYLNLFGRAAEEAGKAYWANLLDRQLISIDNVVTQVAAGAQGSDAVAFKSKVSAATVFTAALPTDPLSTAYGGTAGALAAKAYINAVTDPASLALATNTSNLQAALTVVRAASTPMQSINLTNGVDLIGPASSRTLDGHDSFYANFSASSQTLGAGDKIDGGTGNNTLYINSTTKAPLTIVGDISVAHVQTVNVVAEQAVTLNAASWRDLDTLSVSAKGGGELTAPASANVKLTDVLGAGGLVINGGKDIDVKLSGSDGSGKIVIGSVVAAAGNVTLLNDIMGLANPIEVHAAGNISITDGYSYASGGRYGSKMDLYGGEATTSVQLKTPGSIGTLGITITDQHAGSSVPGVLKTVESQGLGNLTINSNALENLNLKGSLDNITIHNAGLAQTGKRVLNLELETARINQLADDNVYTSMVFNLKGGLETYIESIKNSALTDMTIQGEGNFFLRNYTGLNQLQTITVAGAVTTGADLTGTGVRLVDASAASGQAWQRMSYTLDPGMRYVGGNAIDDITLQPGALNQPIMLGGGNDRLLLNGNSFPAAQLDGGTGTDTLRVSAEFAASISRDSGFTARVKNFENLDILYGFNKSIDLGGFGKLEKVSVVSGLDVTLNGFESGRTLELNHWAGKIEVFNETFAASKTDVLNLLLRDIGNDDNSHFKRSFHASGIETINMEVLFNGIGSSVKDSMFLVANAAKTINVTGNSHFALNSSNGVTSLLDASLLKAEFSFNTEAGGLADGATVKGSASQVNLIDLHFLNGGVNYIGGNSVDRIKVGAGSNQITVGENLIQFGHNMPDTITFSAPNANLQHFTTITDAHPGLILHFLERGNETFGRNAITLAANATLQDYANAAIKQGGDASENGAIHWFAWRGDTYLVESRHDGKANPVYMEGMDLLVKLVGQHDLSRATFNNTEVLVLG